ncbi:UNVERIFIED_CONTAM: putative tatC-like protein ymf16 [Sesamum latifolium]|uniref:TatC-like protein ymf16 n=1 Tax=Sesamum latifolium TaxID=2727402 RepID=A0AAW2RUT6_9LAMI
MGNKGGNTIDSPFKWFSLLLVPVPNSSRVVPNVWHFPYFMGETSTNSLMIKLQPKIYEPYYVNCSYFRSFHRYAPGTCNCDPFARYQGFSVENFHEQSSFFDGFFRLTAALSTPPDIWCQIVARFLISLIIELAIFVASIVEVREEAGRVE